jgi:hypothetical protein
MKVNIRMRDDLAEEGLSVPASTTFSDYDTLDDDLYITAEELDGATQGDDPADPDDHAFCYVQLKDGRSLYFISVDLDYEYIYDKFEIIQTNDGYMVQHMEGKLEGEYLHDSKGDNLFNTYAEAEELLKGATK